MKAYNKSDLTYKDGFIFKGDKVIAIDNEIVDLANKVETDVQRSQHELKQQVCYECYMDSANEPFARKVERKQPVIRPNTPNLDIAVEKAKRIMEDVDDIAQADKANEYLKGIMPFFDFVTDDFVISCEQSRQHRFDLPTLGNPLELTPDDLAGFIIGMFQRN